MSQLKPPAVLRLALTIIFFAVPIIGIRAADALRPGAPLLLKDTHGKFDFLTIDAKRRRLLAAHTGNSSLDVIDIDKTEVIKIIPTGKAQAPVVDLEKNRYYVTASAPPQFVGIDADTFQVVGIVALDGPADLAAFEQKTRRAYIGHDDGSNLWIVEPDAGKVIGTVALPSDSPEDLAFDKVGNRLFQSMKKGNVVAVVDLASGRVIATWPTAPVQAPHGMAMVSESNGLLTVGGNGKLALMSTNDGHIISTADVAPRVDQIAYDHELHRVYCASGTGVITVLSLDKDQLMPLGNAASAEGCHSIAVDPVTHCVWIAYARGDQSFIQSFTPSK